MVAQMLGIDFGWYSFYRGNFAPIALNESCFYLAGCYYIDSRKLGKYAILWIFSTADRPKH